MLVAVLTDVLPEIVDGARKISQGGKWALVSARGRNRRYSLLPMLEAITTSREQCMSALYTLYRTGSTVLWVLQSRVTTCKALG